MLIIYWFFHAVNSEIQYSHADEAFIIPLLKHICGELGRLHALQKTAHSPKLIFMELSWIYIDFCPYDNLLTLEIDDFAVLVDLLMLTLSIIFTKKKLMLCIKIFSPWL